jgi:hypothetical protein
MAETCDARFGHLLFMLTIRPMTLPGTPWLMVIATVLSGCAQQPQIKAQLTPGTDFSRYHTYAIKPGNVVYPGASEAQRAEIEKRVQDAVARELEARGLSPQPDEPELIVTYTAGAQQQKTSNTRVHAAEGVDIRGPSGYDEPGQLRAREGPDVAADMEFRRGYTEGNLVIDLLDGKNRRLIWRATANLELASNRGARMIDSIVAKAFQELPLGTRPLNPTTQP